MTFAHQHIASRINRAAEIERENARMAEIERAATPLFYAVFGIAAAVLVWLVTADYRDVLQHKLDTLADRQQSELISAMLASCANGDAVPFDDGFLTCKIKRFQVAAK